MRSRMKEDRLMRSRRGHLSRRAILRWAALAGAGGWLGLQLSDPGSARVTAALDGEASAGYWLPEPSPRMLPRWRGFNLLGKFNQASSNGVFEEHDFAWIARLGFNFVRLPMDYRFWVESNDWTRLREDVLREIDWTVRLGQRYGLHVCLNFHRAPGFTVAQPPEPRSLWTDSEAQRVCAAHWAHFAARYQGVPNRYLSFNLLNEPLDVEPQVHREVVERLVAAIRQHDSHRLIICDGRDGGRTPPTELLGLGVAAAARGYEPWKLTHFRADWAQGSNQWNVPTYPLWDESSFWDKEAMRRRLVEPWSRLAAQGMGVMVGEWGAYNRTPHPVVLAWMRDCLDLWRHAGWGWALWNFRGAFGPVDSERPDVHYADWGPNKVDLTMMTLLQRF
jgi:endoglucanase